MGHMGKHWGVCKVRLSNYFQNYFTRFPVIMHFRRRVSRPKSAGRCSKELSVRMSHSIERASAPLGMTRSAFDLNESIRRLGSWPSTVGASTNPQPRAKSVRSECIDAISSGRVQRDGLRESSSFVNEPREPISAGTWPREMEDRLSSSRLPVRAEEI